MLRATDAPRDATIVSACTDRHRFQGLQAADTRRTNKVNRARHKELLEQLAHQVDRLSSLDESRTWAILFDVIVNQVGWKSHIRAAAERQGVSLQLYGTYDPKDASLYGFSGADVDRITKRPALEIARLVIETVVRENLAPMEVNGSDVGSCDHAIAWLGLDEIQVGDAVTVDGDPSREGVEYRVEGYVTDRPTIAAAIGKDRAKHTARLVRLSYEGQSGAATPVMLGGRCTTLAEYAQLRKLRSAPTSEPESEASDYETNDVGELDKQQTD